MITPARRSGGVLASALFKSANRLVPAACWPVGVEEETQRTCRLGMSPSRASSSRLMAAVCSGRPAMVWLRLSSVTTMAMLARLSRSSWRSVGLASASSSAASDSALQQGARACAAPAAAPPARRPAPRPPSRPAAAPSARSRATSCSSGFHRIPSPRAGQSARAPEPGRGYRTREGRAQRVDVGACAAPHPSLSPRAGRGWRSAGRGSPHRHCPSRSSSAGTCTWSAL